MTRPACTKEGRFEQDTVQETCKKDNPGQPRTNPKKSKFGFRGLTPYDDTLVL